MQGLGAPQFVGRYQRGGVEVERYVTPITMQFDPVLAAAVQREMNAGKSFDAAVSAVAKQQKRKPRARPAPVAAAAAEDAAEIAMEARARAWLIAIADREHGDFESLNNERLLNIAALATKPFRPLPEWLAIRGGDDESGEG